MVLFREKKENWDVSFTTTDTPRQFMQISTFLIKSQISKSTANSCDRILIT